MPLPPRLRYPPERLALPLAHHVVLGGLELCLLDGGVLAQQLRIAPGVLGDQIAE